METVCRPYQHPNPLYLFSRPAASKTLTPITLKPSPRKPFPSRSLISVRASHSPNPFPKTLQTTLSSLLRPASVAAVAAAALLLARLHSPSPSAASTAAPAVQSQTLPSDNLPEAEKERALEEHLDSHPNDVRGLRALMELKVKSGKLPEAIGAVDRLILLLPGEKDLPLLRAHLQSYSGDTESAKQGFEDLLAKDPFLVEAYHGLVMTASQSDGELSGIVERVEAAMEMCVKAKRKDDLRDFKLLVAQIKVIEGKYENALKVYQELVKEEPRDFRPYLCQGIIYTLLRKNDEAEKQFQKYRRLVPKGHPYAQYFNDNMTAMKVFSQMEENKRKSSLKS